MMWDSLNNKTFDGLTRELAEMIIYYNQPRPERISKGRWRAIVKQIETNSNRNDDGD